MYGLMSPRQICKGTALRVFSSEPRYQNVHTDVIKTAVDMVTEVPCDDEAYDEISDEERIEEDQYGLYEEIGSQSPALCHSSSTDEHSKDSYTAEDVGRARKPRI